MNLTEVIIMLATMEIIDLLDLSDELSEMIIHSEHMLNYEEKKRQLKEDQAAQSLLRTFEDQKRAYDEVQRFGRYHPDYRQTTKETRLMKREVDMLESVAQFKIAERELQNLLDEISEKIAFTISEQIMVPREGALFTGAGCGHGGGCGCSA